MFPLGNIIRSVWRRSENGPLNILLIAENNEKYMSLICQTAHNFYLWSPNGPSWKNAIERKPENLQEISPDWPTSCIDMIICNDRLEQYDAAVSLASRFHLPIVLIDHCSRSVIRPLNAFNRAHVDNPELLNKNPNVIVPTSEHISLSWPTSKIRLVIPIGIDIEKFSIPDSRSYNAAFGPSLTERRVVFDNNTAPQVGEEIFRTFGDSIYTVIPTDSDIVDKERIYQQGDYFINSQNHVTVKMLEAMACGNIPICFSHPDLVELIENGVDGFIVDQSQEIQPLLERLDRLSEEERSQMSENARAKVVSTQSTMEAFISKWESVFNYMRSQYHGISHNSGMSEV